MLAGVFIAGRCCKRYGEQLEPAASKTAEDLRLLCFEPYLVAGLTLDSVGSWLQARSTEQQLVIAGYASPQALLQQISAAMQALAVASNGAGAATDLFLAAAQQLRSVGSALCSFAVPCLCNNPNCSDLSGLTEVGLVSGRSCVWGGCRVARYCGRACQRAVWKQHKPVCAALAAAAAPANAAVQPDAAGAAGPLPAA
jgi:hypothetical protein